MEEEKYGDKKHTIPTQRNTQMYMVSTEWKIYKSNRPCIDRTKTCQMHHKYTKRGADVDSDHFLVRIDWNEKLNIRNQYRAASGKKYEIKDLQKQDTQRRYGQAIKENLELQDIPIEDNIKDKWNKIEMVLQGAATKVIKRNQKKEEKTWFHKECQEAVEARGRARENMVGSNTQENRQRYSEMRRKAKQICM